MKQAKSHVLPGSYCPWTACSCGVASDARKQLTFDASPPGSLHCRATWRPSLSEWQAHSMDQPVDEHTEIDLRSIAGSRQLTAAQHKMLIRNVTGALRPNRDFFLWVLVNVLSAVLLCARRRKDLNPKTFNPV